MSKLFITKEELLSSIDNLLNQTKENKQKYYVTSAIAIVLTAVFMFWIAIQLFIFFMIVFSIAVPVFFLDVFINKIRRILWEK